MMATNDIEGFDKIYMADVLGYKTWGGLLTVTLFNKDSFSGYFFCPI